jgi:hypothetical protein
LHDGKSSTVHGLTTFAPHGRVSDPDSNGSAKKYNGFKDKKNFFVRKKLGLIGSGFTKTLHKGTVQTNVFSLPNPGHTVVVEHMPLNK